MKYLIMDTETTGLGSRDEVIQFSGILVNEEFKMSKLYNWYCETSVPITKEAAATHGLNANLLHVLSHGYTFEDNWLTMEELLNTPDITFIGWNVSFDIRLINQTLALNGLNTFDFGTKRKSLKYSNNRNVFDLMHFVAESMYGRARVALATATADTFVKNKDNRGIIDVDEKFKIFAKATKNDPELSYHNSLYDTFVTYLLFMRNLHKLFV